MKIYCFINIISGCLKFQHYLNGMNNWCNLNDLPLNGTKYIAMTFMKKKCSRIYYCNISGIVLNRPVFIKDLVITFDTKLTFILNVNDFVKSSYKNLGFVIHNSNGFTNTQTLMLSNKNLKYASAYNIYTESWKTFNGIFWNFPLLNWMEPLKMSSAVDFM